MVSYYNEFNPEAAAMLRQLIADGHAAPGDVDTRSITEVQPDDLKGYTQCHFFAGIGGWSIALRLAGWSDDRPVWTGSAPCQPFSAAGKQKGKDDDRHLFPVWLGLIRECRPPAIFGEQVASAVAHGWLDDVYQGLEAEGYACGAAVLPACSVGAPHRRDRLYFVAHAKSQRGGEGFSLTSRSNCGIAEGKGAEFKHNGNGVVANAGGERRQQDAGSAHGNEGTDEGRVPQHNHQPASDGEGTDVAHAQQQGLEGHPRAEDNTRERKGTLRPSAVHSAWCDVGRWVLCPDEKQRLIEPSIPLLVDGFQHRRPILHALGNAIVPQVAAEFIKASL